MLILQDLKGVRGGGGGKQQAGGGRGGETVDCNVWPWKLTHLGSLGPCEKGLRSDQRLTRAPQGVHPFSTRRPPQTELYPSPGGPHGSEDRPLVLQQGNGSQPQGSRSWGETQHSLLASLLSAGPGRRHAPSMTNTIVTRIIIIILQVFARKSFLSSKPSAHLGLLSKPHPTSTETFSLPGHFSLEEGGGGYRIKTPHPVLSLY